MGKREANQKGRGTLLLLRAWGWPTTDCSQELAQHPLQHQSQEAATEMYNLVPGVVGGGEKMSFKV